MESKVQIIITTDASGAVTGFKVAEDSAIKTTNNIEKKISSSAAKIKQHWLAISAVAIAAYAAINKAMDYIDLGARAQQAEASFKSVAASYGISADSMLSKMKELSLGMVDDSALMQRAIKGLQQGLTESQIEKILQISRGAARTASVDIVEAFDAITDATANQVTKGLKHMGIVVDATKAEKEFAASLGLATEQLTEQEKAQALANAVIVEGTRQMQAYGVMQMDARERIQKLRAQIEELKESIGKGLIRVTFGAAAIFQELAAAGLMAAASIFKIAEAIGWLASKTGITKRIRDEMAQFSSNMKTHADAAWEASKDLAVRGIDNFKAMVASADDYTKALGRVKTDGVRPLSEEAKRLAEEWKKVSAELEKKIAVSDLQGAEQEMKALEVEVEQLRKKFGNKPLIQEYFNAESARINKAALEKDNELAAKAYQESFDEIKTTIEAREALEKDLTEANASEYSKRLLNVDAWVKAEKDKAFAAFESWGKYQEDETAILEAASKTRLAIVNEYYSQVEEAEIQNRLALVDIQEKTYAISTDEATGKRIELYQRELQYLKDQYNELEGVDGKLLEQLQLLSKIREVQGTLTDLTTRQGGFSEGVTEGIKEYTEKLEIGFDKGKTLALEMSQKIEDTLVDMFDDPKKAIDDFGEYFLNMLKRLVAQALMNPITVFIKEVFSGSTGQQAGMAGLMQPGSLLSDIAPYFGLALGLYGMYDAYKSGNPLQGAFSGAIAGGSVFGPIGIIVGAITGLIAGLFGGEEEPYTKYSLGFKSGTTRTDYPGGYSINPWENWSVATPEGTSNWKEMKDAWQKTTMKFWDMLKDTALATQWKLPTDWSAEIDVSGMSAEEAKKAIANLFGRFIDEALTGIDIASFQKEGETLIETAGRIIQALTETLPAMKESIQDTIFAIQNSLDISSLVKEQMQKLDDNIIDLWDNLSEMTDPADQISQLDQIRQAVIQRYQEEMKMVVDLQNAIKSLKSEALYFSINMQTKIDELTGSSQAMGMMWDRMTDLFNQIAGPEWKQRPGTPGMIFPIEPVASPIETLTAAERLAKLQEYIQLLDQWVSENIAAIQQQYELQKQAIQSQIDNINSQIDAANIQKQAINDQISALQDQVNLSKQWQSVIDSVEKQILGMKTTSSSPRDIFERMDVMKAEMERVRGLYSGATGEERAGYASDLQSLISEYLGMAQEAFQRPSPEYQAIYSEMLSWLEGIKTDAESQAVSQEDLLAQIAGLQEQSKAIDEQIVAYQSQIKDLNAQMAVLDTQMAADIQAFKDSAVQYYQWAMNEGAKLYQDKITELEDQLKAIIGNGTVEQFIAQLKNETIAELQKIENTLDSILAAFTGLGASIGSLAGFLYNLDIPQSAGGNYFSRPSLTWIAEREPEYVVPASKMGRIGGGGQTVVTIGDIHVHAAPGMDENSLAEAVVKKVEGSIRRGRLGEASKKKVKYG